MLIPDTCHPDCRACPHRGLPYEESLHAKRAWLARALARWDDRVENVRSSGPERRWGYRTKWCLRAERGLRQDGAEGWRFGLLVRERDGSERIVETPRCPVHPEHASVVLRRLSEVLHDHGSLPLVFVAMAGDLLTLVLKAAPGSPAEERLLSVDWGALGANGQVRGVFFNWNPSAGNRVFWSKGWRHIWGAESAEMRYGDRLFRHGPNSFQQQISGLHEEAIGLAMEFLSVDPGAPVIDLYSGVGITSALLRDRGADVVAVELCGEAVAFARKNCPEIMVLRGRVEDRIPQISAWLGARKCSAFVNPPRMGLGERVSGWLAREARPRRVAYLSCSAGTLARDLSVFEAGGYRLSRVVPFDFFPNTAHVESLALLELPWHSEV